jgi:hypothetical protein
VLGYDEVSVIFQTRALALLAVTTVLCACGGKTIGGAEVGDAPVSDGSTGGGDPSAFVGTWTCSTHGTCEDTERSGNTCTVAPAAIPLSFAANPDGTITMQLEEPDAAPICALRFSLSDSTATVIGGQTCSDESGGYDEIVITGGLFALSGSSGTSATIELDLSLPSTEYSDSMTEAIAGGCSKD